jgi:hypothetical protein
VISGGAARDCDDVDHRVVMDFYFASLVVEAAPWEACHSCCLSGCGQTSEIELLYLLLRPIAIDDFESGDGCHTCMPFAKTES